MIVQIADENLAALYQGKSIKRKPQFNETVVIRFVKTVKKLMSSENIAELKAQKSLNFEALKGKLSGKYSVRVDKKYRLIFRIVKNGIVVEDVIVIEELNNHYQ
jgi:proteic killer suppression protein